MLFKRILVLAQDSSCILKSRSSQSSRVLRRSLSDQTSKQERDEARAWLARFSVDDIPKNVRELSFSRSSGPGGQNVNKVNSKATLRLRIDDFLPQVPTMLHPSILASRFFTDSSRTLVIQSDAHRKQKDNIEQCHRKLNDLIVSAGRDAIRGETSEAQVQRMKGLQERGNAMRLLAKKSRASKKAARSKGSRHGD